MTNNIDEFQNQISLMKEALAFYADESNYAENQFTGTEGVSMIEVDEGSQARFALETLEKVEQVNKQMEEDYLDTIKQKLEDQQPPENVVNLIKAIKDAK
jgi:hypothetical protein